jgi:hypothetical protein
MGMNMTVEKRTRGEAYRFYKICFNGIRWSVLVYTSVLNVSVLGRA